MSSREINESLVLSLHESVAVAISASDLFQRSVRDLPNLEHPYGTYKQIAGKTFVAMMTKIALDRLRHDVLIVGAAGHGKTTAAARVIHEYEYLSGETAGCVQYEETQDWMKELYNYETGEAFIDPLTISGGYTEADYFIATQAFLLFHQLALDRFRVVVSETVSLNGILNVENQSIGMERGTRSIARLADMYSLYIIAIVSGEEQYASALRTRKRKAGGRPGGTVLGTELIDQDVYNLLCTLLPGALWSEILKNRDARAVVLERVIFPWLIKSYFNFTRKYNNDEGEIESHYAILRNMHVRDANPKVLERNQKLEQSILESHLMRTWLTEEDKAYVSQMLTAVLYKPRYK